MADDLTLEMTALRVTGDAQKTRKDNEAIMTFRNPRSKSHATFSMVFCGLLPLLTPAAVRAQSNTTTALLDCWRTGFNQRMEDDIGDLASPAGSVTFDVGLRRHGRQYSLPQQTEVSPAPTNIGTGSLPSTVRAILQSQGLPTSLVGVVAIESRFNPSVVSTKGAAGLWQFMPATARQFGLVVNASQDDRFDILKSTLAAAHYLRNLHIQFGDWPLALAAYNAGPNRVLQDLHRFNGVDFWTLRQDFLLPGETRDYVPKVLTWMRSDADQNAKSPLGTDEIQSGQATKLLPMHRHRSEGIVFATLAFDLSGAPNSK